MAVTDAIDLTPPSSFNYIQFNSELLNVITLSLLTSLIAANVGSLISKLINCTPGTAFNFNSWLRGFIFVNSDDPLRILSWIRGRYVYRDPKWVRGKQRFRYRRLVLPMLARCAIFVTTIATIAIAIPNEQVVRGCRNGDYRLKWDESNIELTDDVDGICENIPLRSRVGSVTATASYCTETQRSTQRLAAEDTASSSFVPPASATAPISTLIKVHRSVDDAQVGFLVDNSTGEWSMSFRIEWIDTVKPQALFLTSVADLDLDVYMDIATAALHSEDSECIGGDEEVLNRTDSEFSKSFQCASNAFNLFLRLKRYTRAALVWKASTDTQVRLKLQRGRAIEVTDECPYNISLSVPFLNVLPLTILFAVSLLANLIVSFAVSRHGDVQDAAFHVIKDVFGRDSTSNALEENEENDEIVELRLRKYLCSASDVGHVSYVARDGDHVVKHFDSSIVVGACYSACELRKFPDVV